jgi:hypothetical protein
MNEQRKLVLEVLTGPLDGATFAFQKNTEWSRAGDGPLAFPWDDELGKPQARFTVDERGWSLESFKSPHGTHRVNQGERITTGRIQPAEGDVLKASSTWLLVRQAD